MRETGSVSGLYAGCRALHSEDSDDRVITHYLVLRLEESLWQAQFVFAISFGSRIVTGKRKKSNN